MAVLKSDSSCNCHDSSSSKRSQTNEENEPRPILTTYQLREIALLSLKYMKNYSEKTWIGYCLLFHLPLIPLLSFLLLLLSVCLCTHPMLQFQILTCPDVLRHFMLHCHFTYWYSQANKPVLSME